MTKQTLRFLHVSFKINLHKPKVRLQTNYTTVAKFNGTTTRPRKKTHNILVSVRIVCKSMSITTMSCKIGVNHSTQPM